MAPIGQPSIDFSKLDDATLAQMLKDEGVNVGPINVCTRRTYERKLAKLKTGRPLPPVHQYDPVDDDDDEEVKIQHLPHNLSNSPQSEPAKPRFRPPADNYSSNRIESRPPLSSYRQTVPSHTPGRSSARPQEQKTGIPLWVKLVVVAVIFTLVYLIYLNMEPQVASSVPKIQEAV